MRQQCTGTENSNGQRMMPSNAFCRAIDAEAEMDANDVVAEGLSYSRRDQPPSRHMEVCSFILQEQRAVNEFVKHLSSPHLSSKCVRGLCQGCSFIMS